MLFPPPLFYTHLTTTMHAIYLCNVLYSLLVGIDFSLKLLMLLQLVLQVGWVTVAFIVSYLQFLIDPGLSLIREVQKTVEQ